MNLLAQPGNHSRHRLFAAKGAALCIALFTASALIAEEPTEITIDADQPIMAEVKGNPAQLIIETGSLNRLTLNTEFVAANGIKPAPFFGSASIMLWGAKEIKGKNRPLEYTINGVKEKGRVFWVFDVPQPRFDGTIGPLAVPFDRVIVRLKPLTGSETTYEMPYAGSLNGGSLSYIEEENFATSIQFGIESGRKYPLASAATGAAIAQAYGGELSGELWEEPIIFGITRPVRLMTLERPFVVGPFSFREIAVRTRSVRDRGGSGDIIAEAPNDDDDADPSEIVVNGASPNARKPAFTLHIGRSTLNQCASITFDKQAEKIIFQCPAEPGSPALED